VLLLFQWDDIRGTKQPRYAPVVHSFHAVLELDECPFPDPRNLELDDGWEHCFIAKTQMGHRLIRCNAWRRPADRPEDGNIVTWIFVWAWNANPPPPSDDSEQ